jgi:5-deoxy-glucuronate isomerase
MRIHRDEPFAPGYNAITEMKGKHAEMMMDFGILKLPKEQHFSDHMRYERIFLLLYGQIDISWEGRSERVYRDSYLDDNLWCLNVPQNIAVKITGVGLDSEVAVIRTENERVFPSVVRSGEAIRNEIRGEGTMNETGTRIVRTAQDVDLSPESNIMFGEDVHYPGKWAGFPSHHHQQPEIYFYKLQPDNGFGLMKLGNEAVLLEHNDTVKIAPNLVHPQVAAPGYAMYFLWVIRHLENNPYLAPTFEDEHLWAEQPDAKIWPNR